MGHSAACHDGVKRWALVLACALTASACGGEHLYQIDRRSWEYVQRLPESLRERTAVLATDAEGVLYLESQFVATAPATPAGDRVYINRRERHSSPFDGLLIGFGTPLAILGVGLAAADSGCCGFKGGEVAGVLLAVAGLLAQAAGVTLAIKEDRDVRVTDGRDEWTYVDPTGPRFGIRARRVPVSGTCEVRVPEALETVRDFLARCHVPARVTLRLLIDGELREARVQPHGEEVDSETRVCLAEALAPLHHMTLSDAPIECVVSAVTLRSTH